MNILIAADYRARNSGNFVALLVELSEMLRKENHQVYCVFPMSEEPYPWAAWLEKAAGHPVHWFTREEESTPEAVQKLISRHRIDIVHMHFDYLRRLLIRQPKAFKNVRVLIHDHMGFSVNKATIKERCKYAAVSIRFHMSGYGVVSVFHEKDKVYRLCGRKHWYVPNGLSLRRNIPSSMAREERRQLLGISPDQTLCLLLGWDFRRKGVDIAVSGIAKARETDRSLVLGFVGTGSAPSEQLQMFIRNETGQDPFVSWIRYFESTEDIFSYHRAADVFLSVSRSEGFPYAILEAVSENSPMVVTSIDSQLYAKEYSNAFMIPPENVEACAEAVLKAKAAGRKTSNGAQILRRYSSVKWCREMLRIYDFMMRE